MSPLKTCTSLSLLCLFALLQSGCSISYSLEKSSDSVSASLDSLTSISTSSSGDSAEETKINETGTLFEEDVAAATVLYVSREKTTDDYQRQVASIAKTHGITDWEQDESTYIGMGKGLRRAGVSEESIANLPYFRSLSGSASYSTILKGYKM